MMKFTTYMRSTAVDIGKNFSLSRSAGGLNSRSHFTPHLANAPTERMFAPRFHTSRTSSVIDTTTS